MRAFVERGDHAVTGLVALGLATVGVVTFGWASYLALFGAAGLMLVAARAAQESLPFPGRDDWRVDAHTREVARRGLADARAALDRCQRRRTLQKRAHEARGGPR